MHPVPFLCILFILSCSTSCMADNTKTLGELIGLQPHRNNSSAQLNKTTRLDLALFLYKLSKTQQQLNNNIINQQQEIPPVGDEELAKRRREAENLNQQTLAASRVRKQGCKVFFWKSFTAC